MNTHILLSSLLSFSMLTATIHAKYAVDATVAQDLSTLSEQLVRQKNLKLLPVDLENAVLALAKARSHQLSPDEASKLVYAFNTALKDTALDGTLFEQLNTTTAMDFADLLIRDILLIGTTKQKPLTILTSRARALIQNKNGEIDPVVEKALNFFKLTEEFLNPAPSKVKPLMYYCDKFSEIFRDTDGNVVPGLEKLDQFFAGIRSETKVGGLSEIFYTIFGRELNDPIRFAEQTFRALLAVDPEKPYALYCDKIIPLLCDETGSVKPEFTELHAFLIRHRSSKHLAAVLEDAQKLGDKLQVQHQATFNSGSNQYLAEWNRMITKLSQQYNPTAVITALQRRLAANRRFLQTYKR